MESSIFAPPCCFDWLECQIFGGKTKDYYVIDSLQFSLLQRFPDLLIPSLVPGSGLGGLTPGTYIHRYNVLGCPMISYLFTNC